MVPKIQISLKYFLDRKCSKMNIVVLLQEDKLHRAT